jgi:hypothetical protein
VSFGWYLARPRGAPIGPLRAEALIRRVRGGSLSPAELVWKDGFDGWKKIAQVPELIGDLLADDDAAPDTPPETIREASLRFDHEPPETKRADVPADVLKRARGSVVPAPGRSGQSNDGADAAPGPRVLADAVTETNPALRAQAADEGETIEALPPTLDFGSRGLVIVTPGAPPAPRPRLALAPAESVPSHTLRLPNAPAHPRDNHPIIPIYDEASYEQLMAEQEDPPPQSAPPPPYPTNFPAPEAPPPAAAPAPVASGEPAKPGSTAAKSAILPASRGGRWVLVLVTLLAVALGFLAARYVVRMPRAAERGAP